MNQILVTEKLYVTPELKRKKKFYKISFMLSIFLIIILCSCYIYAEYDRNKESEVSKDILEELSVLLDEEEIIKQEENVWKITVASRDRLEEQERENQQQQQQQQNQQNQHAQAVTTTYKASNGKTYDIVGRITIPKIKVEEVILANTTVDLLKVAPCRFYGPEKPNEVGNFCIAGHNYRNSRFFSKVPKSLGVGDIIEIADITGTKVKYSVYDKYTVDPDDISCLDQVTNGKKVVTLITCTDDGKQRVIVHAREII